MKKLLIGSVCGVFMLVGCASTSSNMNITKSIKNNEINQMLMNKYNITKSNLIKFGKDYIFFAPSPNGIRIVFLNKKYQYIKSFTTSYYLEVRKIAVYDNKIYVLGIDEKTYYPELLVLNKNGKIVNKIIIKKKYAIPKDLYLQNKNNYVMIDVFANGKSYIEIYKNGKLLKKITLKHAINGTFIFKDGNDLFVVGTIKNTTQDAFIINLTKGWIRFFNTGEDDSFERYSIKNGNIVLMLHSTDEMGEGSYYEIIINKDGKILKSKCKIRFNRLPLRFRT